MRAWRLTTLSAAVAAIAFVHAGCGESDPTAQRQQLGEQGTDGQSADGRKDRADGTTEGRCLRVCLQGDDADEMGRQKTGQGQMICESFCAPSPECKLVCEQGVQFVESEPRCAAGNACSGKEDGTGQDDGDARCGLDQPPVEMAPPCYWECPPPPLPCEADADPDDGCCRVDKGCDDGSCAPPNKQNKQICEQRCDEACVQRHKAESHDGQDVEEQCCQQLCRPCKEDGCEPPQPTGCQYQCDDDCLRQHHLDGQDKQLAQEKCCQEICNSCRYECDQECIEKVSGKNKDTGDKAIEETCCRQVCGAPQPPATDNQRCEKGCGSSDEQDGQYRCDGQSDPACNT